jgi:hypothetical protein
MSTAKTFQPAPEYKFEDAPEWYPSLCIPRVFPNITWQYVKYVIEECCWGEVERVDMVKKTNAKGEEYKRVFIHMKKWNPEGNVPALRKKIIEENADLKIYYEEDQTKPWFWKISKSRVARPVSKLKMPPTEPVTKPRVVEVDESELNALREKLAEQEAALKRLQQMTPGAPVKAPSTMSYSDMVKGKQLKFE